ncbi:MULTISPECIES: hypothetical protein [unclassified Caballeronia]|uniref:hypothetical protein n=1 Tax=unclassified Caballeronia TaxID=2646786 RepID=UPI00158C9AC3|nr:MULTISPECIES: hypothetical protein [unclassified Caballeronia]QSN64046.1 hypothetical protein JYK05_22290 [Caballeronia sp. M1242]
MRPNWRYLHERQTHREIDDKSFAATLYAMFALFVRALDIVRVVGLFLLLTISMWVYQSIEKLLNRGAKSSRQ